MVQDEFKGKKPSVQCFYDMDIASKVYQYYQSDFEFAKDNDIDYEYV